VVLQGDGSDGGAHQAGALGDVDVLLPPEVDAGGRSNATTAGRARRVHRGFLMESFRALSTPSRLDGACGGTVAGAYLR